MTGHLVLVTGTLAEPALRTMADRLERQFKITADVVVLNIQVAALMTPQWVARKLRLPEGARPDRVVLPGYCEGDLSELSARLGVEVTRGPRDLRDLAAMLGGTTDDEYGDYDIEIIAEINHACRMEPAAVLDAANDLAAAGADIIDVGCAPHADRPAWTGIGEVVRALRDRGLRVSVDSFHPEEIAAACRAGAELVLSVNATNCDAAADWGAAVVAIPDDPAELGGLEATLARLERDGVSCRIDPVLEPIGFGFARSLERYLEARRRFPDADMMMGIGNLSEMTGVDSPGVNALLIGICQELSVRSVLTTQVINWARSCVREIDVARRLMHHAVARGTVPKHQDERLVMLRDARLHPVDEAALEQLAANLTDRNIRLFADVMRGVVHAMNRDGHHRDEDPYVVFERLGIDDPGHAFYLGYEMCKAVTAITLGKNYVQDEPLSWGLLTRGENRHHDAGR